MKKLTIGPAIATEETIDTTRQRILDAAAEVFAEEGFRAATIRQIIQKAGANIAAVNYHFGGKAQLYSEVFKSVMHAGLTEFPVDLDLPAHPTPEQRLYAYVRSFFLRAFSGSGCGTHLGRIILREMVEPTPELNRRINDTMRPMANYLRSIVQQIVDRPMSEEEYFYCCTSVVSQIVFHKHCREVISRMFPGRKYERSDLEDLARHVTKFSIAGLHAMRQKTQKKGKE